MGTKIEKYNEKYYNKELNIYDYLPNIFKRMPSIFIKKTV